MSKILKQATLTTTSLNKCAVEANIQFNATNLATTTLECASQCQTDLIYKHTIPWTWCSHQRPIIKTAIDQCKPSAPTRCYHGNTHHGNCHQRSYDLIAMLSLGPRWNVSMTVTTAVSNYLRWW